MVSEPNSERASGIFCSADRFSGKLEIMRPESEISRFSTTTPAALVKVLITGSNE